MHCLGAGGRGLGAALGSVVVVVAVADAVAADLSQPQTTSIRLSPTFRPFPIIAHGNPATA